VPTCVAQITAQAVTHALELLLEPKTSAAMAMSVQNRMTLSADMLQLSDLAMHERGATTE
jgi:hypothetical protein